MKRVVVVGGGFAGSLVVRKLETIFSVTLIDTKEYFEFTPSVPRTLVQPANVRKIQALHSHYLHKATIIKGEVENITPQEVTVGKKKIPFDYLVIASGSSYKSKIKGGHIVMAARASELRNYAQKLQEASRVLVIGGGLVGVELAAEIIETYPEKKVVLCHSGSSLMERNQKKAQEYAQQFLEKRGVEIVFYERIEKNKGTKCYTASGKCIDADLTFLCTGIIPNYEHLGICSTNLNERNLLCVNEYLQVEGYQTIFAAGDITNLKEEKTAQAAEKQAAVVVQNIVALENETVLKKYQLSKPKPMVISLGKTHGILVYKEFVLTGLLPGIMKSLIEWKAMRPYR